MIVETRANDDMVQATPHEHGANYQYWREHGGEWGDEYDQRKTRFVYYHIQELMLADYFSHAAPARVLEYGCGVGRHLSYLSKIPNLDIYGYDQSQAMVDQCLRWTSHEWLDQHVTVGPPVGRLPYPDRHFDIVFTSEVLVHVSPADLELVLSELIRISRWQLLHMEPAPFTQVVADAHAGCWNHDLAAAYQRIGHTCELLVPGFEVQTPYRVALSTDRELFTWPPLALALMRRLEQDIQPKVVQAAETAARLQAEQEQARARAAQLEAEQEQARLLSDKVASLEA